MTTSRIGIIGVGPRGLTVLERIVAHERQSRSGDLEIFLFDPSPPGAGCHDPEQADFHLVNTVAGQLTLFSDASVLNAGPVMNGPSFAQWLHEQSGMRTGEVDDHELISPDAYYSRGLFGRYLLWAFRYVCGMAPPHVRIHCKKTSVTRAHRCDDDTWILETPEAKVLVNYLFLTTGHTKPASSEIPAAPRSPKETLVIEDPYPMRSKLAAIAPGVKVAVEGMGLTTFDVVADLTVGRGGRFTVCPSTGNTRYLPSGMEPKIVLFSRSGLPLSARAINQKGVSGQYKSRFLHAQTLRDLRATRKLDFATDVLPLLVADMEYAYYDAYLRQKDAVTAVLFCNQFSRADAPQRQALIERHVPKQDRFSWDLLAAPIPTPALADQAAFSAWLTAHLHNDVKEARRGNLNSPLKAACDVLRDLRDNLRAAIDFGGLTEESHRWVLSEFLPIMNRLAVGPPLSRIGEMLALMEAGILRADFGPGASVASNGPGEKMRVRSVRWASQSEPIDVCVKARISMHSPLDDASPLLRGLLSDGHARLFHNGGFHPGGIEIDRNYNWIDAKGAVVENAWALGIPTEGIKFCTFVIPRPGVNSTALVDAGRAVGRLLGAIGSGKSGRPTPVFLPTEEEASAYASLYGGL
ncbi:FAD/NAD(P)-binding protein [Piscinibacter terrae]|uniref:FAD/NAD(P)-binding protein n=1 Tax=Piscinibacter terrae TaxID=2496871 RepID=UPI00138686CB|nr:FAD/NAD(P)-binding protein [Albitalea terrae]